MEIPLVPRPSTSKSSRKKFIDDDNACMMYDGQILLDSWVREDIGILKEELKNHDGSSNSSRVREDNIDKIMELNDVPPSPPPLRPDPPSVPRTSTSKPSRKKSDVILIPDDEYNEIIANLDLDAFILFAGRLSTSGKWTSLPCIVSGHLWARCSTCKSPIPGLRRNL